MDEEKVLLAGKIAEAALQQGKPLIKEGKSILEVTKKVEEKIYSMGGKLGFPVNISRNHVAAHNVALLKDTTTFEDGDVVKLDVGVHIDGWIADNALTVSIGDKHKDLVNASRNALNSAIKILKPGIQVREIGRVIQETITRAGFSPIKNLSGHLIERYVVHAGITIPNYDNKDPRILEEGMLIAIEPFATTGEGIIMEGKGSGIFRIDKKKPVRNLQVKKILEYLEKEYKTLPFSMRAVNMPMVEYAFSVLEKEKIISQYPQLVERSKGLVSQAEHTILIKDKPIVTTKTDD
ncbi:MAG: type II methionyl aminopeptidase [Nanoarchaeota archaeon]